VALPLALLEYGKAIILMKFMRIGLVESLKLNERSVLVIPKVAQLLARE